MSMALDHRPTARLTDHARQRVAEMGATTKRVKRIVADPDVTRVNRREGCVAMVRDDDPDLTVIVTFVDGHPVVITVLGRQADRFHPRAEDPTHPAQPNREDTTR